MAILDSLDKRLLELLGENASQSGEALAKKLDVSPSTVRRRIRRLNQSGILRTAALVHPAKVGFPLVAVMAFDVSHDKLESVTEKLAARPEVKFVTTTTGRFDVLAFVWFRSTDELSEFVQKDLATVDGIRDTETFLCLQVKKGLYTQMS